MDTTFAPQAPIFGGKLRDSRYYDAVSHIIRILRTQASLRLIAEHLNREGFTTPSRLNWTKGRVAEYIKSTAFTKGN